MNYKIEPKPQLPLILIEPVNQNTMHKINRFNPASPWFTQWSKARVVTKYIDKTLLKHIQMQVMQVTHFFIAIVLKLFLGEQEQVT